MANRYDTNLILERIADSLDDDQNSALIASLDDIASAIGGGGGSGAGLVSDAFDDTRTYAVGNYCIHNNTLYRCTTAIQTPGAWNINDWQATNAGTELSTLNSKTLQHIDSQAIDLSTLSWTARTGCWNASRTLSQLFGTTEIESVQLVSYSGVPCMVFLDGNYVVFTQWAGTISSGNTVKVRGIKKKLG